MALIRHRSGWQTLLYKELLRFWKVSFQTILAPVLTSLLYLLIFSHVLESHVSVFDGQIRYTAFLIPGLVMMSVLQNAFANSSSSLIQSKITGNLIFVLLPPLSPLDLFAAYVVGVLRLLAGIWGDKFDQLAAFQNFLIMPLTFLSGVFYSIHTLPPFWQRLSHFNPFFYMIDGFRYGFFGLSDVEPALSLAIIAVSCGALSALTLWVLKRGYKLRH